MMIAVYPSDLVQFLDATFKSYGPELEKLNHDNQPLMGYALPEVSAAMDLFEVVTPGLIVLAPRDMARLVVATSHIRHCLAQWRKGQTEYQLRRRENLGNQNPLKVLYDLIKKCPDEAATFETTSLSFITPPSWRETLRLDLSSAHKALVHGEWKTATVLAGSVIEALLLWAIQKKLKPVTLTANRPRPTDPATWHLDDYLKCAVGSKLISHDAAEIGAKVKSFRNLIHPGNAQRNAMECDKGTAYVALGLSEKIASELEKVKGKL